MKILTNAQIRELDQFTIEHEPITSVALMERASKAIVDEFVRRWQDDTPVVVFAGPGNNGGDALAVARMLAERGYKVDACLFNIHNSLTEGCAINKQRVMDSKKLHSFTEVTSSFDPPELRAEHVVVDGLFGSGLNKPLAGGFASLVKYINHSDATVVSIDMPSGLMTEDNTYNIWSNVVKADLTLTLQLRKLSMMLADAQPFTGEVKVLDIGLSREYIEVAPAHYTIVEESYVRSRMMRRPDFAHKGNMGTAFVVAGCRGMAGAATLATRACLRSGVGKVIIHTPKSNNGIVQISVPEAIVQGDKSDVYFSEPVETDAFDAMGIGPGLGTSEETAIAVIAQIRRTRCPQVIDADALNVLSSHRAWLQQLPAGIILTPHAKEMDRLAGMACNSWYERLGKARALAEQRDAYIILKGHNTAICKPDGDVIFNVTGNSGMATAGAGDVLLGVLTGLLARGYSQLDACVIGTYLHGLAGDLAATRLGKESLIASDIIEYLPAAFMRLSGE